MLSPLCQKCKKKIFNFVICLALQARQNKAQLIKNVIDTTHQKLMSNKIYFRGMLTHIAILLLWILMR